MRWVTGLGCGVFGTGHLCFGREGAGHLRECVLSPSAGRPLLHWIHLPSCWPPESAGSLGVGFVHAIGPALREPQAVQHLAGGPSEQEAGCLGVVGSVWGHRSTPVPHPSLGSVWGSGSGDRVSRSGRRVPLGVLALLCLPSVSSVVPPGTLGARLGVTLRPCWRRWSVGGILRLIRSLFKLVVTLPQRGPTAGGTPPRPRQGALAPSCSAEGLGDARPRCHSLCVCHVPRR